MINGITPFSMINIYSTWKAGQIVEYIMLANVREAYHDLWGNICSCKGRLAGWGKQQRGCYPHAAFPMGVPA